MDIHRFTGLDSEQGNRANNDSWRYKGFPGELEQQLETRVYKRWSYGKNFDFTF